MGFPALSQVGGLIFMYGSTESMFGDIGRLFSWSLLFSDLFLPLFLTGEPKNVLNNFVLLNEKSGKR